jgi:4-alpha-glucanotransferase
LNFPRASGILLHPTSLPGPFGIGDLGAESYRFVDFLVASGQRYWQVLPLGPTGYGDSPYACYSAFAGNTLLISPERLVEAGLLDQSDLDQAPKFSEERVDFETVRQFKDQLLARAFERFNQSSDEGSRRAFEEFCQRQSAWLDDYALFRALKDDHGGKSWHEWDGPLVHRDALALGRAREALREQVEAQRFYQFLFFQQWSDLKTHCHQRGIKLIGDVPIFVAHDSADVWTNPDQFKLDDEGKPLVVAGVPPDYFSKTGQLWGNPLYNWDQMRSCGFKWWIDRVHATLQTIDLLRLDHFRGFVACWEIPAADRTAERGRWVETPGRELFASIRNALGELPVIAEDLGMVTPEVEKLRAEFDFPGMRVLQFAFGGDAENRDLPHNYQRNVVVYTGTHDNDTTVGWFNALAGEPPTREAKEIEREREFCREYLNTAGKEIHWDFIRAALASVGNTAIIPLQDVLGLGSEARMNLPNTTTGNWAWRFNTEALSERITERLSEITALYGRARTGAALNLFDS